MDTSQIYEFYVDKEKIDCPITNKLIGAGYQQGYSGYIKYAYEQKQEIDYKKGKPHQWWHLIKSYCERTENDVKFTKRIQCGELLIWMAEVSRCVDSDKLNSLVDKIIESGIPVKRRNRNLPPLKFDRRKWNKEIQNLCFDEIVKCVEM